MAVTKTSLAAWAAAAAIASVAAAQAPAARPNVVFVLIDDMGIGDLSCYDKQAAPTPQIDRVAREGIRFANYYSSAPICSPSRCALITGQYPQRWKITSFIDNRAANEQRGLAQWLDTSAPSFARDLQSAGYATGHFGKWHLGGGRDVGEAPLITEYGFDQSLTQFEGLGDRVLNVFDKHDGTPTERSGLTLASERLGRGKIAWVDRSSVTTSFVDRTIGFIDGASKAGKPFYVNVWPDDVHSPFFPPAALRGDEEKRTLYRGVVQAMDTQLGKLFDHVRDTPALRDNTIVIVASDNGPEPGAGTAPGYRGVKGQLYEGGIREPFIVWSPKLVDAKAVGTTNDASVIAGMDVAPSVLELAGVTSDAKRDGVSFATTLLGKEQATRTTPIFWRRPPDRPGPPRNPMPDLAMRDGDFKLLVMRDGSSPQLYDIRADPGEQANLAAKEPERAKAMTKAALDWNAPLPKDNPTRPRPTTTADNGG